MTLPEIATREEWLAARRALLEEEKAFTRRADALATQRRMLPMVEIEEPYTFTGPDDSLSLLSLFEGRRQLIVYHFMFHPDWEDGCSSCTAGRDDGYDFGATIDESRGASTFNYRGRTNDESGHDPFFDSDQPFDMPGRSCFIRENDRVFHTYSHFARATEGTQTPYALLDLTAMGRQEDWEEPKGRADDARPPQPAFER